MLHRSRRMMALVAGVGLVALLVGAGRPQPAVVPSEVPTPAVPASSQPAVGVNLATVPADRKDAWWVERFESITERAKQGDVGIVFMGDSITQGWEGAGKDVWAAKYASRKAMNCGIGGDRTQQLLHRIQNGNVEGLDKPVKDGAATPKLVVMMIGTNNSNKDDFTAAQIAEGVKMCLDTTKAKLPQAKVLLLGIFPRGEKPDAQRDKIKATNEILKTFGDNRVTYLDIGAKFTGEDGTISKDVMPDFLHLSAKGYQIWADAIEPSVKQLLGES